MTSQEQHEADLAEYAKKHKEILEHNANTSMRLDVVRNRFQKIRHELDDLTARADMI
jgi:hypothetical protein